MIKKKLLEIMEILENKHIIASCTFLNLVLIVIVFITKDSQKEIIDAISIFVLALTFIVIVIYTNETMILRKVTEKQLALSILPIVNLISIGNEIKIRNSGKNPALNIEIQPVDNRLHPRLGTHLGRGGPYSFKFGSSIPLLSPDEERIIPVTVVSPPTGHQNPPADSFLNPINLDFSGEYELKINYDDIELKKKISTIFVINQKGINFKKINYS